MKSISSLLSVLALAQSITASPVVKRQSASSAASLSESAVPVASASASAVANGSASTESYLFSCPSPYLLTYVEHDATVTQSISDVLAALGNFTSGNYLGQIATNGEGNTIGANRTVALGDQLSTETLTTFEQNTTSLAVTEIFTSPGNLTFGSLSIGNYTAELEIFTNDTVTPSQTTIKYFANFCSSSQLLGQQALGGYADFVFANVTRLLTAGSASASAGPSAGPSAASSALVSEAASSAVVSSSASA